MVGGGGGDGGWVVIKSSNTTQWHPTLTDTPLGSARFSLSKSQRHFCLAPYSLKKVKRNFCYQNGERSQIKDTNIVSYARKNEEIHPR